MRRLLAAALFLGLVAAPRGASAQPRRSPPPATEPVEEPPADEAPLDEEPADEDWGAEEEEPGLRAPEVESPDVGFEDDETWADEEEAEPLDEGEATEPTVDEATSLLNQAAPQSSDATRPVWTAPASVFTLHGYLRVRGEYQDSFNLGHRTLTDLPWALFTPGDAGATVVGGCPGDPTSPTCFNGSDKMRFASMRMRLEPTFALSDDVRVHMMVDVFDNMVLGSTPNSLVFSAPGAVPSDGVVPGLSRDTFAYTLVSPTVTRNSLQDSIIVRRAWAEVVNRDIGILRFGRMGNHWGLGMLYNGGSGIDSDFQSDVDRVMGITRVAGFLFGAAWDFTGEGVVRFPTALNDIPRDASQKDDIRQFSFFAAHRLEEEEQAERLANGRFVLNGGLYFMFRKQNYSSFALPGSVNLGSGAGDVLSVNSDPFGRNALHLVHRDAQVFTLDFWGQFLWKTLRIEIEAAANFGSVGNMGTTESAASDPLHILQFGAVLETEYRTLAEKLGIYFYSGFATGDRDVSGLSVYEDTITQQNNTNHRISNFTFHPNYRVDLILFRNVLGAIGGAYYLRPGISYDLIRDRFGQLLGIRADMVYSRASQEVQTYGSNPNLGIELDGQIYYRTEDGPEFWDGFYAAFQYGILFPLAGLDQLNDTSVNLHRAQTLRLVMGVQF
jgi:uncharacterized protein (TIGR04551 family)